MSAYLDTSASEAGRRPEEIESDLERTRAEVSSTIDAIQSKLTPGQMMDQAFAYARTSLPAEFGANLAGTVRENPVPVTLLGIGLAWLMVSSSRRTSSSSAWARPEGPYDDEYDDPYAYEGSAYPDAGGMQGDKLRRAADAVTGKAEDWKERAGQTASQAAQAASELGQRVEDAASSAGTRARNAAHHARERLGDTAAHARARAGDLAQRSQRQYYRTKDGIHHMVDEQPLMVAVMGVAAGALLGALLPTTRREDRLMGGTRDELMDRAAEVAKEKAERVKTSARHVADVAKEEAETVAREATAGKTATDERSADMGSSSRSSPGNAATSSRPGAGAEVKPEEQYDEVPVDEAHI